MKRINLLFLLSSLGVGGTERNILNLTLRLNKQKFNPVICCLYNLGAIGTKLSKSNSNIKIYHNLMRNRWDISAVWKLICILKNEKIDIILTESHAPTQFLSVVCTKIAKIKANLTRIGGTNLPNDTKRRIVNKIMLRFVNKIIVQAHNHKEYLICSEGFKSENMTVIYNGVDLEQFAKPDDSETLREELGIHKGGPVVGIVARLSPEKGHQIFLKGAEKILKSFPNTKFLIVGEGAEKETLEKMSQELNIKSNICFMGSRKDIPRLVSLFDVAVLVSFPVRETFSNAILEYMALSKPVVASNVGSISEQVIDNETGFLIPPGDHEALADKILELLNNPELADNMGAAGREFAEMNFSVKRMVNQYEALFTELMN